MITRASIILGLFLSNCQSEMKERRSATVNTRCVSQGAYETVTQGLQIADNSATLNPNAPYVESSESGQLAHDGTVVASSTPNAEYDLSSDPVAIDEEAPKPNSEYAATEEISGDLDKDGIVVANPNCSDEK